MIVLLLTQNVLLVFFVALHLARGGLYHLFGLKDQPVYMFVFWHIAVDPVNISVDNLTLLHAMSFLYNYLKEYYSACL